MAYTFDSSLDQNIDTSSSPVTSRPMTLAAWFNTASTSGSLVSNQIKTFPAGFHLSLDSQKVSALISNGLFGPSVNGATNYTLNSWQHGCVVFGTSNTFVYLNGTQDASGAAGAYSQPSPDNIAMARRDFFSGTSIYYTGQLAEAGIWSVELTDAEIASLAKGMTCEKVSPQNLVFYAPLVRNLIDYSGGLVLTNNNSATVSNHTRVYS